MPKSRKDLPLRLSVIYVLAGLIWITLNDSLLVPLFEQQHIGYFELLFNWLFVVFSAGILYFVTKRGLARAQFAQQQLLQNMEELKDTYDKLACDISERKQFEEAFSYQSHHDFLTGLPNRILFNDRLAQALAQARRRKRKSQKVAVISLDMDRFKLINDSLGHTMGDKLLQAASLRLKGSLREGDTIARQGGDEFIILLPELSKENDVVIVAQKILDVLTEPFALDSQEVYITASIGISLYPADGNTSEELIKHADTAMNYAKESGRNNYQFFTTALNLAATKRLTLENNLRKALEREEFVLYYQPQICLNSGKIIGTEALLRWRRPDGTLLAPGQFIPIAEETGLIIPIGEWVLRTACAQNRIWQNMGFLSQRLAVNLSARQFRQPDLVAMVAKILHETGLNPRWLVLEITESIAMDDVKYTVEMLQELKKMGIRLAIDDFGTGFSSLSYLKRFPIDTLKIDKTFVRDIGTEGGEIVTSIILLAQNLNLKVIAEGVETPEQCAFLMQHRCDEMQGYLFSRPLPPAKFERLIREGRHFKVEEQLTLFN